jgi:hypothetical protein
MTPALAVEPNALPAVRLIGWLAVVLIMALPRPQPSTGICDRGKAYRKDDHSEYVEPMVGIVHSPEDRGWNTDQKTENGKNSR